MKKSFNLMSELMSAKDFPENIDEATKYTFDLDGFRGLFGKTVNGSVLIDIYSNKKHTTLETVRKKVLDYYKVNGIVPDPKEVTEDLVLDFYGTCERALSIQQDKTKEITIDLKKEYFAEALREMKQNLSEGEHLKNWINGETLARLLKDLVNTWNSGEYKKYREELANELETAVTRAKNRINVYHGGPGCGKSTGAAKEANRYDKKAVISLSNTVGNMFKQKLRGDIDAYSVTRARYQFKHNSYNVIVIDEFSQWSLTELQLFIDLLNKNPVSIFIIMGDINQIPTFLSSGSILYTLMKFIPDRVTEFKTQYRFMNNPSYRDAMKAVLEGDIPEEMRIEALSEDVFKRTDCFITGTNKNVDMLNKISLLVKNPEIQPYLSMNDTSVDLSLALKFAKNPKKIPLIANNTVKLMNRGSEFRIYTNTRYSLDRIDPFGKFILESQVDHSLIAVSENQLKSYFALGYAITVNKSQGLEWNSICVYVTSQDRNLKNFNAMYVAVSRGIEAMILATDENKSFTRSELNSIVKIRYKFTSIINDKE